MKYLRSAYALALASVVTPLVTFAQYGPYLPQGGYQTNPQFYYGGGTSYGGYGGNGQARGAGITNLQSLLGIVQTLIGYFQVIIFLYALWSILRAALTMAGGGSWRGSSDGKGGGSKGASDQVLNAVYGILLALLAFSVIPLACWITQSSGPACNL